MSYMDKLLRTRKYGDLSEEGMWFHYSLFYLEFNNMPMNC
jgi:hypothetical protein